MKTSSDIWEEMGSLPPEELLHVMTTLFSVYEEKMKHDPDRPEALRFFNYLDAAICQTSQCNSNRR